MHVSAEPSMPKHQTVHYRAIVGRALEMMRGRMEEPVDVADICRAEGISSRTLARAFHAIHGVSPSRYLHALRLREARQMLLSADDETATVTEVATRFGFVELGRFAVAYRSAFGETPSTTLRRSAEAGRRPPSSSDARKA